MADDDLPIDVHYDKLIDWLVDRKKVSKDWRKKLAVVHLKLSELARELPGTLTRAHGLGVPDSSVVDNVGESQNLDYFRAVLVRDRIVAGADLRKDTKSDRSAEDADETSATDPASEEVSDESEKVEREKTRGLFGRLTGKAKAWDDVVRAYERDLLHLPECGSTMTRAADYEAPFRKRESARLAKQLGDAERREAEYKWSAAAAKEKFEKMCADVFGAEEGRRLTVSENSHSRDEAFFRARVDGLVDDLDSVFDAAVALARRDAVGEAAEHYARWTEWAHGERIRAGAKKEGEGNGRVTVQSLVPHLARLRAIETSAEAEALGREDKKSFSRSAEKDEKDSADVASTTDIDVPDVVPPPTGGIDWDVEVAAEADGVIVEPPAGGIDWDVGVVDVNATERDGHESTSNAVEIDWDVGDVLEVDVDATIGVETIGAEAQSSAPIEIDWDVGGVVVEDAGDASAETNVATKTFRADILSTTRDDASNDSNDGKSEDASFGRCFNDREFRARVLDDLLELRAFLTQRSIDAGAVGGESATLLLSAPAEIRALCGDAAELKKLAAACEAPVQILAEDNNRRLLLVQASSRYRARLVSDLVAAGRLESKFLAFSNEAREKQEETRRLLRREALKAEAIKKALSEVKRFAENAISAMYKGRTVHIIGEINNALAG